MPWPSMRAVGADPRTSLAGIPTTTAAAAPRRDALPASLASEHDQQRVGRGGKGEQRRVRTREGG
eukprot:1691439-Rhodomonas_salina.1